MQSVYCFQELVLLTVTEMVQLSCWHTFYQLCDRKEFSSLIAIHNYCLPEILNEKLIIFLTLNIGVDFKLKNCFVRNSGIDNWIHEIQSTRHLLEIL